MFTEATILAIKLLTAIKQGNILSVIENGNMLVDENQSHEINEILHRLLEAGIISCGTGSSRGEMQSYKLNYELSEISLTQLLIALKSGIYIVPAQAEEEEIYNKYGVNSRRLGILNQMVRRMLSEIKISI